MVNKARTSELYLYHRGMLLKDTRLAFSCRNTFCDS